MFGRPLQLARPGLFITGTDTGVGKTVVTCAIAMALRRQLSDGPGNSRLGVCKPMASGCRREREGLVSGDTEALAHFADCRQPLDVINPVRYAAPVAPAVAAEMSGQAVDFTAIARSLEVLDSTSDFLLIEGVGGLMVPIDHAHPGRTILDMIVALGYPVAVVARAALGTLNHTAMTVALLRQAKCRIAGIIINGYDPDSSKQGDRAADLSMSSNRQWLARMTRLPILATVPICPTAEVAVEKGKLSPAVVEAVAVTYWPEVLAAPTGNRGRAE
ncbi:MAG: dethiobiotin synthase [Phycisphaeraceae bacterium]